MLTALIWFLIYVGAIVLLISIAIWFLRDICGLPLPARAIQILWGIVALLALLMLLNVLAGGASVPRVLPLLR
jgi:NADH:ubiquinone oxidoreductase subunit 6 (subunit J)